MMKQFKNVLCVGCVNNNAGCPNCPLRDNINQDIETAQTDADVEAENDADEMEIDYALNRKNRGYQRRRYNIKERVHHDIVLDIVFSQDFWYMIKNRRKILNRNITELIKVAEVWQKEYADMSCAEMISDLKAARQFGAIAKDVWWGDDTLLKIRLEFPNKKSLELFRNSKAA